MCEVQIKITLHIWKDSAPFYKSVLIYSVILIKDTDLNISWGFFNEKRVVTNSAVAQWGEGVVLQPQGRRFDPRSPR